MDGACWVCFVAGIHPSRTRVSGSSESVRWNACVHRLDLELYSHPKELLGSQKSKLAPRKNPLYQRLRGGSDPQGCITQDSKPNTLPTELFWLDSTYNCFLFILGNEKWPLEIPVKGSWWPSYFSIQWEHWSLTWYSPSVYRLDDLVGASASRADDQGFESYICQDFSRLSHTSDLKIGTPVAILPGAWHYRVSSGTGPPGVSILWLGEMESLICNFYLSVAAFKLALANPSLRDTSILLGHKQPTDQQTSLCGSGVAHTRKNCVVYAKKEQATQIWKYRAFTVRKKQWPHTSKCV